MDCVGTKKCGRYREVAVSGGLTVECTILWSKSTRMHHFSLIKNNFRRSKCPEPPLACCIGAWKSVELRIRTRLQYITGSLV